MDINVDKLKLEYIAEKIQVLLIDAQGFVAESCDSVFPFSQEKDSLFAKVPFFDTVSRVLPDMRYDDPPLCFDRSVLDFKGKHCLCDVLLSKKYYNGRELYELIIENKTLYYQFYEQMQLQNDGNSSYLELLNEQIALRNEIERLRTEEKKRWQQQKRTFLLQLAVHFEQPIANALALCSLLENQPESLTQWQKPLGASLQQIEEIRQYLLDLAAPNELPLRPENFNLKKIVQNLQDLLSARLLKPIEISVFFDEKIAENLFFDLVKLKQVLNFACEVFLQTQNKISLQVSILAENKNEQLINFDISGKAIHVDKNERRIWAERVADSFGGKLKISPTGDKISFFAPMQFADNQSVGNDSNTKTILFALGNRPDETALKNALTEANFEVISVSPSKLKEKGYEKGNKAPVLVVNSSDFDTEQLKMLEMQFSPHFFVVSADFDNNFSFFCVLKVPLHPKSFIRKIKQSYTVNYMEKIDLTYIRDIVDNQPELIAGMLKILEKNMREYPVLMHKELESGNLKALRETAHKFKSSTAYTGLSQFNQTLNKIELCEEQNLSLEDIKALIDEIALAAVQIRTQVEELIQQQLA